MQIIKRILNHLGVYRTYIIKIGEVFFNIPIFNKLGFANLNLAEPWMQIVLRKLGNEESIFLDVGVNVGQTLLRWKAEYPKSIYIGVEPNTDCVYYVNRLIIENNIRNASVLPIAFSNQQSLDFLYISKTDPSDSTASTIKDFRGNENRKSMPIVSIPFSLLGDKYEFSLIKIDVEGGEMNIIKSIFNYGKSNAVIICEILPVYNTENFERLKRQKEIEKILKINNYSIYRIIKDKKILLNKIETIEIHSNLELCDYLFIPENKVDEIVSKFN